MGNGGWSRIKFYHSDFAGLLSSFKHSLDPRRAAHSVHHLGFAGQLVLWTPHTANVW